MLIVFQLKPKSCQNQIDLSAFGGPILLKEHSGIHHIYYYFLLFSLFLLWVQRIGRFFHFFALPLALSLHYPLFFALPPADILGAVLIAVYHIVVNFFALPISRNFFVVQQYLSHLYCRAHVVFAL